jgi:hypothetical protein
VSQQVWHKKTNKQKRGEKTIKKKKKKKEEVKKEGLGGCRIVEL